MGLIPATLSLLLSIAAASPLSRPYDAPVTKYLISFGDSYSQTGFNLSRGVPSTSNILGFPTLPGWTSSKGNNWVTYLATEFNSSLLLSYNFASGGATTDAAIVAGYKPYPEVLSFINQVDQFTEYAKQGAGILGNKELLQKDALFAVWMGVNDVGNSYWLGNVSDVITAIMTQRTKLMSTLYDGGARQFVLLSVPRKSAIIFKGEEVLYQRTSQLNLSSALSYSDNALTGSGKPRYRENHHRQIQ